jgi:pyrroloquinoline-quinone synthase
VDFWTEIEAVRQRHDVLTHSFYQRWSAGELTREELAVYAGEYSHAVIALASASANAAAAAEPEHRAGLESHAREEASHVALWDDFAAAVGADPALARREPAPETVACARDWAGEGRSFLGSLVALYAIESAQPAISETKRAGLLEHYGFEDGPGTAYFTLHAELDREHAAAARALIEPRLTKADGEALVAEAERVLRANLRLLDGVERLNGRV